jgi:glucans biosynthesis protein C
MTTQARTHPQTRTETAQSVAASPAKVLAVSRMFFIDNLRVFLTIVVVIFHLAITYGADASWFYRERPTTELAGIILNLFLILTQFYFMGLFFLISGYFVPGSLNRKGSLRYSKDRLIRLGIPLVLYAFLISPFTEYVKGIVEGYVSGSLGQYYLSCWRNLNVTPGPLWFVEVLLVFTLVYVFGRIVLDWVKRNASKTAPNIAKKPLTHGLIIAFILVLAPLSFVTRLIIPIGTEWIHIGVAFFPQYIFLFAVGILAFHQDWLPDLPSRVRKVWSVIAFLCILALPVIMISSGSAEGFEPFLGGFTWQAALLSTWEAIYCVSMSILMLSLFRARFDLQGSLARFLSRNAYTVYIIHPVVIIPLALLFRGVSADPLLKFVLISPVAVALCFLVSSLIRRIPYADQVL